MTDAAPYLAKQAASPVPGDEAPHFASDAVSVLSIANVGLTYSTADGPLQALRDVSFDISDGEFVSLLGPSGCGKSSLLKMILGLEKATYGKIKFNGKAIEGPSRGVGAVYQSPVLLPWRTIGENVLLPIDVMKLDRNVALPRARELLAMAGLADFETRYPYELSGGMQQRAGIVRALIHDPHLLLMDEPFAALDAMNRELMGLELQRIWMEKQKTVVFITHSVSEAAFLSDRIVVMSARPGRIVDIFANSAPRPRSMSDLSSPAFGDLCDRIRRCLDLSGKH